MKYILKKQETITDNLSVIIYASKIENRIMFEIKTGYYLELLTSCLETTQVVISLTILLLSARLKSLVYICS